MGIFTDSYTLYTLSLSSIRSTPLTIVAVACLPRTFPGAHHADGVLLVLRLLLAPLLFVLAIGDDRSAQLAPGFSHRKQRQKQPWWVQEAAGFE